MDILYVILAFVLLAVGYTWFKNCNKPKKPSIWQLNQQQERHLDRQIMERFEADKKGVPPPQGSQNSQNSQSSQSTNCFFDISVNGQVQGRIVMEMFTKVTPKTCQNFIKLCDGSANLQNMQSFPKLANFPPKKL